MKDRLLEFRRGLRTESSEMSTSGLEANFRNDQTEQQWLLVNDNSTGLLHEFLTEMGDIADEILKMESCLQKIQSIHSKILLEPGVHPQYTDELNQHVEQFKGFSKQNKTRLQVMKTMAENTGELDSSMSRIKQNQIFYVRRRLLHVLSSFNDEQVRYKEKCKNTICRFLEVSGREMPDDDIEMAIESGRIFDYTKGMMLAHNDKLILYEEAKSRREDILLLENSIRELHGIFLDMSMLVDSQGTIVDNIEMNVGAAADYASKARSNVRKALTAQRGSRKKKILLLIFCIIFVMIAFSVGSTLFCVYVPICGGR